jgi:hypothetical protein
VRRRQRRVPNTSALRRGLAIRPDAAASRYKIAVDAAPWDRESCFAVAVKAGVGKPAPS